MTEEQLGIEDPNQWARLKPRQHDTLQYIKDCVNSRGYPPTMREIAEHTGVQVSTARSDLDRLAAEGKIVIEWGRPRAIRIVEEK